MKEVIEAFRNSTTILVTSHSGIDGDSAGGAVAILTAARRMGKTVYYQNSDPIPHWLDFIPGIEQIREPIPEGTEFDLGLIIDTSGADRVGSVWPRISAIPKIAVIDHHEGDGAASKIAWIDARAASVTIMIAELFESLKVPLDRDVAIPLYVGLFTDTYAFQQTNTDVRAMEWGAKFVAAGVRPFDIATSVFENRKLAAVKIAGLAATRATIEDGICWSWVTQKDFKDLGAHDSDTDGVVGTLRTIGGARVAVIFKEQSDGRTKVNLRSKDATDVAGVAARFGGGGHRAAAGCTIEGTLDAVREKVLAAIREAF